MKRTARISGLAENELHVLTHNMLMVNLSDEEHSFLNFRDDKHGINMDAISAVSKLVARHQSRIILWKNTRELEKIIHRGT